MPTPERWRPYSSLALTQRTCASYKVSSLARRSDHGSTLSDRVAKPNVLASKRNRCGLRNNQGRERNKGDRNTLRTHLHRARRRSKPILIVAISV